MILFLTMMILMTFAIWFVQFCALIIHCHFCHGQVCTLQWGSNTKQVPVIVFLWQLSCFWCWVCQTLEKEDITSLSIFQIFVSIDFTFQFNLVVNICLWPHDHHELQEKKYMERPEKFFLRKNTWKGHLIRVPFPQLPNISKRINYIMSNTGRVQLILHKNFHAANSSFYLYRTTQIVNKTENVIQTRGDMIDMIKIIFLDESSAMSQIGRQPTAIVQHGF